MSEIVIEVQERDDTATAKAPRWLNWWRAKVTGVASCEACGASITVLRGDAFAGDYCDHTVFYDSKFMAEIGALQCECPDWLEYVGAYAEGEQP